MTLADKADGARRWCIDYRRVNQKTIPDKQPMPYIAKLIEKLRVSGFFTKLDMASAYWQVAMHPEDIQKTAFVTADGHFEWFVLPFGLKNALATFQRIIRKVLGDLLNHGVLSYLDDIVIYAKTEQEHHAPLKQLRSCSKDLTITTSNSNERNINSLSHKLSSLDTSSAMMRSDPYMEKSKSYLTFYRP